MIVSSNPRPTLNEFEQLMIKTDAFLNEDALKRPEYYKKRGGNPLEDDVRDALTETAKGTPFENTIEKISGHKFPDIIASKLYGVEVKSTKEDKWKSTGSSILETTRVESVDRIFLTFGKLGGAPIKFISKPYEKCLYDISVTHSPRYLIDMQLAEGQTIFDKMGTTYDTLRKKDDPIAPVVDYYKGQLKEGESLWWASNSVDESVSAKIRLWRTLPLEEKLTYSVYGCVNFPEVYGGDYDRYALWLTSQGVVDSHIRDQFSAGGKEIMKLANGEEVPFPAIYRRTKKNALSIIRRLAQENPYELHGTPSLSTEEISRRLVKWVDDVSKSSVVDTQTSMDALSTLFWGSSCVSVLPSSEPWWKDKI